jgi:hypothetical protein
MTPQAIVNESRQKTKVWLEQGEPRREPSLAVYDPFSASAAAHFTSCFAAMTEHARACATPTNTPCTLVALTSAITLAAPAVLAASAASSSPAATAALAASAVFGVSRTSCATSLPQLGDADGPAHVVTMMTNTGAYILLGTKEDL